MDRKIIEARFVNEDRSLIQVKYKVDDKIEVDNISIKQKKFQNLIKEYTLAQIHLDTKNWIAQENKAHKTHIEQIAEDQGFIKRNDNPYLEFFKLLDPEVVPDKAVLFKIKLDAMEMLKSQPKEIKAKIRKAKTVREIIETILYYL
tara:strand:+ start:340 stop:777 length:438 start_codon:yes stop_codon:yes gene_type:complete